MNPVHVVTLLLILSGAAVMIINIRKSRTVFRTLYQVSTADAEKVKWFFRAHEILMLFFLVGYAIVAYAIFTQVDLASELFVGIIFFFGAIFVYIGIILKSKMIAAIRNRYDQAVATGKMLQEEQKNQEKANLELINEIDERRRVEKELRDSRTFLQNLIDVLPEQITVINRDYSIALANAKARENAPPGKIIADLTCHQVSHLSETPCTGAEHPCPLNEIDRLRKPVTMEHVHHDAHGNKMYVEIIAAPIFDEEGHIIQIIEACRDITNRKRSAEKIVESERKYRTILESIQEGYFEIDLEGSLTFFNHSMCEILGYSPEEMRGLNYRDYTTPETASKMFKAFNAALESQRLTFLADYEIVTASGETKPVELSAVLRKDKYGDAIGFRGVVRDVSKIARARAALDESEERYKKLSEVTIEGICFHDKGILLDANDSFLKMFGFTLDELAGQNMRDFIFAPGHRSTVIKMASAGSTRPYEVMCQRKDGSTFPAEIEGRNARYLNKSVRVVAIRDISERRQTEEKLAQVQKMEAIGTLAGGIAHDFNNILSAIMGYTEILRMEAEEGHPTWEKLGRILQASHRARDLVHQILAFSRQQEEVLQPVQISLIAREALKLLRASIPTTIEFRTEIEKDSGTVMADPTRIHQILMNLCTNAAHAMLATGGTLTVSVKSKNLDAISAGHNPDFNNGHYVLLTVTDTGHGMDPKTVPRIFEPYFTTKEPGIGTGLGLSAVHGIVQRTGGTIEVFSEPGQGSMFKLYFPMIENDIKVDLEDQAALQYGNEKILLVDDDEIVIEITREMLKSFGYQVDTRMSSLDALNAFHQHPEKYDLVLTDLTMPQMPGDRLTEKLKEIRPDIPVVLCTGFSETLTAKKRSQLGISGFLMKPIGMRDLATTIRAALDEKQGP